MTWASLTAGRWAASSAARWARLAAFLASYSALLPIRSPSQLACAQVVDKLHFWPSRSDQTRFEFVVCLLEDGAGLQTRPFRPVYRRQSSRNYLSSASRAFASSSSLVSKPSVNQS